MNRERDNHHVEHSVQNGFGNGAFADLFPGAGLEGLARDRDNRDSVTVTRDRDMSRSGLNGQRDRDERDQRGSGDMSDLEIREEFRRLKARIAAKERDVDALQTHVGALEAMVAEAVRRGDETAKLAIALCEKQGIDPAPLRTAMVVDALLPRSLESEMGVPEPPPAGETEVDVVDVPLQIALTSGFRLLMFHANVSRIDEAQRQLSEHDVLCLEEVHRSAIALGRGDEDAEGKAFALYMLWVDKFARDAVIGRQKKTPCDLVVRVSHYLTAILPEARLRWTRDKAVREWRKISGE